MNIVIFYEKPGCATNKKQKKALRDSGCVVIERDLMDHGMSPDELHSFFLNTPVQEWFNPNAPQIKAGYVNPSVLNEQEALKLLLSEPILIKRPLLVINKQRMSGFTQHRIEALLNISFAASVSARCSSHEEHCSVDERSVS